MPPPSTPIPSRFLLSKRPGPGPSQGGRNDEGGLTPTQTQPRQFTPTPRFAAPSTTQPQSQFITTLVPGSSSRPFVTSSVKVAKASVDDIDVVDSSQLLEEEEDDDDDDDDDDNDENDENGVDGGQTSRPWRRGGLRKRDSIVETSPSPSPLSERSIGSNHGIFEANQHGDEDIAPAPKRRRISISPSPIEHVSSSSQEPPNVDIPQLVAGEMPLIPASEPDETEHDAPLHYHYGDRSSENSSNERSTKSDDSSKLITENAASDDVEMSFEANLEHAQQQQAAVPYRHPKFQEAPRFVATEPSEPRQFYLPDAFSPQRRGARHIPGGLAAEVRDWLFQVKGNANETQYSLNAKQAPPFANSAADYVADQVSTGPGIQVLMGRHAWNKEACSLIGKDTEQTQHGAKLILAGGGRISGLAGRNIVMQDTVVVVYPPTWEIDLQDQGIWTMVCDWAIADDITSGSPPGGRLLTK